MLLSSFILSKQPAHTLDNDEKERVESEWGKTGLQEDGGKDERFTRGLDWTGSVCPPSPQRRALHTTASRREIEDLDAGENQVTSMEQAERCWRQWRKLYFLHGFHI